MLAVLLVPVLLGLSMLAQRPLARWLEVPGPVWPLFPFEPEVRLSHRLAIRGAGVLFTLAVVLAVLFLQARREQHLSPRVVAAPGMAAAQAGVQTGDLITAVDGVPVNDFAAIRDELLQGPPTKELTLVRGEQTLKLQVTLRDGLLGVTPAGEPQETSAAVALGTALRRFFVTPLLTVPTLLSPATLETRAAPRAWVAALTVTLTLSFWLMLLVEAAALGLGPLLRRS